VSSGERFALGVAVALGVVVRLVPVLGAAGAVGDGGLIHAMVDDIRATGMGIPATTSYNELGIPFAYPPLSLLLAAFLGEGTGASTLDVLRWLPLLLSIGGLVAFAWLAWRVLPPVAAISATFAYALMPHAYDWVIAGGGLTRGLGLLAALVAMALAAGRPTESIRLPALAGLALGVAVLSHPQAAIFGAVGCLVLSLAPPAGRWARNAAVAAAVALVVALPWLSGIVATHGVAILANPANRFEPLVGLIRLGNLRFSGAPFMDVFAVAGAVGVLVAVVRGPRRVPLLLLLTYLFGAGGGEFLAAVPWALACGIGAAAVIDLLRGAGSVRLPRPAVAAAAGVVLFLALIGSLGAAADGSSKLHALSEGHLEAMTWMAANADDGARVLVPTAGVWGDDEVSEWLPALAERQSIGTVQGSEWLGADAFDAQLATHNEIRDCSGSTVACYAAIDSGALLFIPKGQLGGPFSPGDCCPALRETVEQAGYRVVYDGTGATIAEPASGD
jgi:predicted aspartyl protease